MSRRPPPVASAPPCRLGVNIDHIATLRRARGESYPDPLRALPLLVEGGADGVTAHLREDRRHMEDGDIERLAERSSLPLNLEMAAIPEMTALACRLRPHACCLVPERRAELTTEGGLDAVALRDSLAPVVRRLREAGIRVSLFLDPAPEQVAAAAAVGAQAVELHTGLWARAGSESLKERCLEDLATAAERVVSLGLECHAGHGLTYENVAPVAALSMVLELNIGHFLIAESVFVGLAPAVAAMRRRMDEARGVA